jgi:predicted nucleic acid-binding protein
VGNRPVVIDASTLLNLLATGEVESILGSLAVEKFVCPIAADEVLYLRSMNPEEPHERVSIHPLFEAGLLTLARLESAEEEARFVDFASVLDDGEAMSLAICLCRDYRLATDDRKARRIAETPSKPVPLLAASEIISRWARKSAIGSAKLREVLAAVELRARFRPWPGYPLRDWWIKKSTGPTSPDPHR